MAAYQVTSPLVVVRTAEGGPFVHVYEGGFIPDDADADHVKQLLESGMIVEADAPSDGEESKPTRKRG